MEKDLEKFKAWLVARGRDPGTASCYASELARCLAGDPITARTVDKRLAPKYRHFIVAALRSWATFNKDGDLLVELKDVRLPPAKRKAVRRPLEREDWLLLLDEIRDSKHLEPAIQGVLGIMSIRGLRIGDILRMKRSEAQRALDTGRLLLETKGGAQSDFTARPVLEGLRLLLDCGGKWTRVEDLISPDAQDKRRSARKRCHTALRRMAKRVGLDPVEVYPHRLRRTYAVEFLRSLKGDPEALQKLVSQMQWASPGTAMMYTDYVSGEALDEVDDRLRKR